MHQGVDVVGTELQRLGEVGDRALEVAAAGVEDDAAVQVRGDVLGIPLDRLGVVRVGLIRLLERVIGEAALELGEGELGIEPQALVEVGDRPPVVLAGEIDAAARDEDARLGRD